MLICMAPHRTLTVFIVSVECDFVNLLKDKQQYNSIIRTVSETFNYDTYKLGLLVEINEMRLSALLMLQYGIPPY